MRDLIPSTPILEEWNRWAAYKYMNFELLGFLGTAIITIAYFPQILELWKKKDSTGISITAWAVWLLGTLMIWPQAFY